MELWSKTWDFFAIFSKRKVEMNLNCSISMNTCTIDLILFRVSFVDRVDVFSKFDGRNRWGIDGDESGPVWLHNSCNGLGIFGIPGTKFT